MAGQGRHQTLPQRTVGRRSLVLGGVAAAGTAVLAGGGGSLAAPAPARRASSAARAAQDVTEIEFWHGFAAHEIAALQDMLDQRFAPTHPTIKVNAVGGADAAKILAAISGGNPPDVVLLPSPDAIGTWAHNGALQPLDDHIKSAGVDLGAFVPTGLEQCKLGDAYFALPFVNFNRALYWNKDLFKAAGLDPEVPPKTIDEMLSFAEKLTKKDGDSIAQIGVLPSLSLDEMAWRFGGDWYDAAGGKVSADSPANRKALQFELDLANKVGGVDAVKRFQASQATGGGAADNPFYQGKIAMMLEGCWQVAFIDKYANGLNYGVTPVPAPPDVPDGATVNRLMTNPIGLPTGAKHLPEGWELLRFLATDVETSREFAKVIANIPQLTAAFTDFTDDPRLKVFVDLSAAKGARAFPVLPITAQYTDAIATLETSVLTGETELGPGFEQLQSDMQTELDKATK